MSAMALIVKRIAVVVDKVIAMNIINKPVPVVINSVASNLTGIDPHICGQIGVTVINSSVNNRNNDVTRTRTHTPGFGGVNIRVRRATALPRVMEAVEVTVAGIIRAGGR